MPRRYCLVCAWSTDNDDVPDCKCGAELCDQPSYDYCMATLKSAKTPKEFLDRFRHPKLDKHRHRCFCVLRGWWSETPPYLINQNKVHENRILKQLLEKKVIIHKAEWVEYENGYKAMPSTFEYNEGNLTLEE